MPVLPIKPPVIKPVGAPPPGPTERDITIEGWEEKATEHMELAQQGEQQIRSLVTEFEELQRIHLRPPWLPDWLRGLPAGITLMGPFGPRAELASFKPRIQEVEFQVEREDFYTRLYSQVPFVIASGRSADPEEILALLQPSPSITPAELDEVRDTILSMVEVLTGEVPAAPEGYPTPEQLDAMTPERRAEIEKLMAVTPPGEVPELPELVVPTDVTGTPTAIHKLTINAIIESLTAPKVPPSVMSEEEWADFMVESGQISSKADLEQVEFMQDTADSIIDEWQERNNMLASYRDAVAEMPDYELIDLAKEAVIQPGLALLTIAGAYFEHVSMPLAGAIYKTFIPDIEVEYQRLKKTEGSWMALSYAWESWDPELWLFDDSAAEWIMKYILMEGLVDPLTYVGWGIATRLTKPLGPVGRMVGSVERGVAATMEIPFDMLKFPFKARWSPEALKRLRLPKKWEGELVVPRTHGQLATISMHKTGQYVDKFLTKRYGRALYQMTMKEWDEGVKFATKYTLSHPQIDNEITRAGRELLKHVPVTEREALEWAERLGSTLKPEDITRNTIDSLDMVFETWFTHTGGKNKLMPTQEAADEIVRVLFGKQTAESSVAAGRILTQRASHIIADAGSFSTSRTTFQAMRSLMQRNYKFQIKTMESYAALARKEMGSVATMLDDIPIRVQKAWQNGIDKWIVRPFAESYLTFALYGPMNVIEDIIRTGLGGIRPGRKTPQAFARKWAGTSYDVDLMRDAVSETYGYLRSRRPGELNNWILQLGGLAKGFGDNIYDFMVRRPGQIGISMRRNFVDRRATQFLRDMGGDTFQRLATVGPTKLTGVTNRKIAKEVQQVATELKIQGLPEAIRASKDDFTRANVVRREVDHILTEHPDLPRPVRDYIMRSYDDGVVFREAGTSIDDTIRTADNAMLDDFITSPERASTQFEQLADMLTQLEVRNPKEMAHLIQSLNTMSSIYGATPKQILGRAVERTRGLPFAERRLSIDKTLDSITVFRERAGASMDKVVERIKLRMRDGPAYPTLKTVKPGNTPIIGVVAPDGYIEGYTLRVAKEADFHHHFALSSKGLNYYENVDDSLRWIWYEAGGKFDKHTVTLEGNTILDPYGKGKKQIQQFADHMIDQGAHPDMGIDIAQMKLGTEFEGKSIGTLRDWTTKQVAGDLGLPPKYVSKAEQLFNLQTAKRLRGSELGEEISAWRHQFFADADPKALHTQEFWDDFDRQVIARHHAANVEMADFDGQIKVAIDDLDVAGGLKPRQRPALKIVDRELAPNDVAQLIGARGDDISRSLLDVMTAQNDKDMFVSYVMAHVKPDDVGFSKESVGAVYDQIADSLRVPPEQMSWLSGRRIELEAVRRDFHALYNSKLLPDEEITSIGRYLDDTAEAVEDLMYEFTGPIIKGFRSGQRRATIGPSATEGTGLYVSTSKKFTDRFGTSKGVNFRYPRNPLDVIDESVPILEGNHRLWDPITDADTEWMRLNKQAVKNLDISKPEGWQHMIIRDTETAKMLRTHQPKLGDELARLSKAKGYDAVHIEFTRTRYSDLYAGDSWYVLFDESLWKGVSGPTKRLRTEFAGYDDMRQQAMDEAHKWYYKEFTDYSNSNAFDSFLKAIYPFWTYESQRWFWLPRSFVRHPGTFTAFERWQNNTDYGYLHIPGTSVDIGIGRGTVYGTLQTRLTRRDYPEYYDSLGAAGDVIEFSDFLSRYGFYPGAHIGIPLAMFGGVEMQMGEAMPAFVKTPLDALIALYPDNESVKWISERLFGDRFRNYMTILTVNKLGGDGTLIFTKQKENVALTPEEEQIWADARREVGWYAAGFEQFGLFRMRTDEQHKMYEEASKVIEEMTGYTPDQQDWLRKHGYRLWDMVGGMSPTEQAILQEMDYYRWVGNIRPLLPGKQQEILNQIELGWNAVDKYSQTVQTGKLQLQADLLTGVRGPDDYNVALLELYDDQRKFIDNKIEEIPLMALENRAEYYKTYKVPQPVLHPMRELLNLFFSIELTEVVDPETGEIVRDWDNFWAQRQAIEDAIPEDLKPEWEDFLGRNSTRMEETRREVYHNYFRTYNKVWEKILTTYPEDEQEMIEEYLYLERTGSDLDRQAVIKATPSQKTGNMLISSFRTEVSGAKKALRYHNPTLDAWLYYWGKTSTFTSPTGEEVYYELARITGRKI